MVYLIFETEHSFSYSRLLLVSVALGKQQALICQIKEPHHH